MSLSRLQCSDEIKAAVKSSGACRCGVARCEPVESESVREYEGWLAAGRHAGMHYMERYMEIRRDPRLLLEGARSIISCAYAYEAPKEGCRIAAYALGDDYHDALRKRLEPVGMWIKARYGGDYRICVDTAPIRERYWAQRAGVGFIGLNNQLIVPGAGSYVLLAEIITTVDFEPDMPLEDGCGKCMACVRACPSGAIDGSGSGADGKRCISYLTIEHRGEFPEGSSIYGRIYGCDICSMVCPHNQHRDGDICVIEELQPRLEVESLGSEDVMGMDQEGFSRIFRRSAIKRAKLAGLRRNCR